jgi:cyanobactin maturation PatA/PatG family protease
LIAAVPSQPVPTGAVSPSVVQPAACACQGPSAAPQLVYVIGQPGYDLVSEARLDALAQKMAGSNTPERGAVFQPAKMLAYLESHPSDAGAVEWTLSLDGTPIYAIRPQGPFAAEAYQELRRFLREQLEEGVERISVPGIITGKARLLMGQVVPVIAPELRGMYSWSTKALVEAVVGPAPAAEAHAEAKAKHEQKSTGLRNFLDRVYHALRNLGVMPADRAVNFAATNAYSIEKAFEAALKEKERVELESINVARSPICRPSSDCWDVEVYFFFPDRPVQTVRKVYRFTVDVSDVVPVTIGATRSWFTR